MRRWFMFIIILCCFAALFLVCYSPVFFADHQFGYRDAGHYYYPLHQRVQQEWNEGRTPLWEPEENAGMPLLGNPTAAVFYPGKLVFAFLPYAWGARVYIVIHTAIAFVATLIMMRGWGVSWVGSGVSALAYAFGAPVLFQYCNVIYLVGASWLPLGVHAVDRLLRMGRRSSLLELAIVLALQVLGGDPQAAYLLGLAAVGYAVGIAWNRARLERGLLDKSSDPSRAGTRVWWLIPAFAIGFMILCVATVMLGQWLPRFRDMSKPPPPPLPGMSSVPLGVNVVWGMFGLWFIERWRHRAWRSPLALMWLGLVVSAVLAAALSAIQLLPVVEFTQLTSRAAGGGPHDIYPFSLAPLRLAELVWPNISGIQYEGNEFWGQALKLPGYRAKVWVPSLYVGGLTLVLAMSALGFRKGPPWRIWLSVIVVLSLVGSLGEFTSPIRTARLLAQVDGAGNFRKMIAGLGPLDPIDTTPIRQDGCLRDGDGSVYWWMTTVLPGFRQFRFPSKLFTFTTLGIAALAGIGWDQLGAGRTRIVTAMLSLLLTVSWILLGGVLYERQAIIARFQATPANSMFGPFSPEGAFRVLVQSLIHASIVFGVGLIIRRLVGRHQGLAGAILLIAVTADLAAANGRLIFTVPQALFETRPEVARIIEEAEHTTPSPGPYRVHRMPIWSPRIWQKMTSSNRVSDFVEWERKTLQPKYAINHGIEYTHTMGVAELYDYEWYFGGFYRTIRNKKIADSLGVELGAEVVYFPRRSYDMWNTRYFVVPSHPNGWKDEMRGYASFSFQTETVYPDPARFRGAKGAGPLKDWLENQDFQILRNLQEFPRAWVVHAGRTMKPLTELSRENREEAITEIVYADDPLWHDESRRVFNPRSLVWIDRDAVRDLNPYLSGPPPRPSEAVTVSYPDPQRAVLDVTLESKGVVVLADVYYPGWNLTIDDKPAPIYQVNRMMRGAAVPAGPHHLVYTFSPRSFLVGRIVSMLAVAVLIVASLFNSVGNTRPMTTSRTWSARWIMPSWSKSRRRPRRRNHDDIGSPDNSQGFAAGRLTAGNAAAVLASDGGDDPRTIRLEVLGSGGTGLPIFSR